MEYYTFKINEIVSQEFLDKLNNGYIFKRFKIIFDKVIENNDNINLSFSGRNIVFIHKTIEYYNNVIEVACSPFNSYDNWGIELDKHHCFFTFSNFIISIEIIIVKKNKYNMIIFDDSEKGMFSNEFKTFEELKNYFIGFDEKINEEIYNDFIKYYEYYNNLYIKNKLLNNEYVCLSTKN